MAVTTFPASTIPHTENGRIAGYSVQRELLMFLHSGVERLVPAIHEALARRGETEQSMGLDVNAHELLTTDLILVLIALSVVDHGMFDFDISLVSAICLAMEDDLRHSPTELYRRAWNAFTSEEYDRLHTVSLLRDHYDKIYQSDLAVEARDFLYRFAVTVVTMDSEVDVIEINEPGDVAVNTLIAEGERVTADRWTLLSYHCGGHKMATNKKPATDGRAVCRDAAVGLGHG